MSTFLRRTSLACVVALTFSAQVNGQERTPLPSTGATRYPVQRSVQDSPAEYGATNYGVRPASTNEPSAPRPLPRTTPPNTYRPPVAEANPQRVYAAPQGQGPVGERRLPAQGAAPAPAPSQYARPIPRPVVAPEYGAANYGGAPGVRQAAALRPVEVGTPRQPGYGDVRRTDYQPAPPQPLPDESGEALAPPTGAFTLNELTLMAEQRHPLLDRAASEIEAAKGGRVQAGLYPNPRFETNNPEIFAGRNSQVNFGFQQDIVTKGKLRLDKAAADQYVRKMEAKYLIERMHLLTEIRTQYYQTLAAHQRVLVNREFVRLSAEAVKTAQQLVDAGQGGSTDVLLISTEYERARVKHENATTTLAGELSQLAAMSGDPNLRITALQGSIFDPLPKFDNEELRQFLAMRSNHVEMGGADITRHQVLLRREEVEPYPNIRMGPAYAIGTGGSNDSQFWLSVVFDIPVWNLNQGAIREARADVQSSVAQLDATRAELLRRQAEVYSRHVAARTAVERIRLTILPGAQKAQQQVGEGFARGLFDVNRMLQARRSLLEVNDDLIDALERAWTTAAELAGMMQQEQFP